MTHISSNNTNVHVQAPPEEVKVDEKAAEKEKEAPPKSAKTTMEGVGTVNITVLSKSMPTEAKNTLIEQSRAKIEGLVKNLELGSPKNVEIGITAKGEVRTIKITQESGKKIGDYGQHLEKSMKNGLKELGNLKGQKADLEKSMDSAKHEAKEGIKQKIAELDSKISSLNEKLEGVQSKMTHLQNVQKQFNEQVKHERAIPKEGVVEEKEPHKEGAKTSGSPRPEHRSHVGERVGIISKEEREDIKSTDESHTEESHTEEIETKSKVPEQQAKVVEGLHLSPKETTSSLLPGQQDVLQRVNKEFQTTEQSYCKSMSDTTERLKFMAKNTKDPETKKFLESAAVKFAEMHEQSSHILNQFNTALQDVDLDKQSINIMKTVNPKTSDTAKQYSDTCGWVTNNYDRLLEEVGKWESKNVGNKEYKALKETQKGSLETGSLIIMPVQRLPRYVLLSGELAKRLPSGPLSELAKLTQTNWKEQTDTNDANKQSYDTEVVLNDFNKSVSKMDGKQFTDQLGGIFKNHGRFTYEVRTPGFLPFFHLRKQSKVILALKG